MSFPVNFFKFNKKPNSTKQPSDDDAVVVNCDFWGVFDMAKPILVVELGMEVITKYTYAQVPLWGKAYFVETYGWDNGHVTVTLTPDPMGTYKSFITARTQYIIRSNVVIDNTIVDGQYPATIYRDGVKVPTNSFFTKAGVYVIAVAGKTGSKYYVLNITGMNALMGFMFGEKQDDLWSTIVNATGTDMVKTFLNAFSYIRGAWWLPVAWDASTAVETIQLGYWDTGIAGNLSMPPTTKTISYTMTIPKNPAAVGKKLFLLSPPYTSYQMIIPYCGTYTLDATLLANRTSLTIIMDIDIMGNIVGSIKAGDTILRFSGTCATELQLTESTYSVVKAGQTLLQTAGVATTAALTGGLTAAAAGGVISAANAPHPEVMSVGGSGGYVESAQNVIELNAYFYDIAPQSTGVIGCPCYKNIAPSSNGWYQCADAQIDWVDEMYEYDTIKQYMDTGFWVE